MKLIRTVFATLLAVVVLPAFGAPPAAPPAPPEYYGVIELGSKGIKPIVVQPGPRLPNGQLDLAKFVKKYSPKNKNPYDGDSAEVAKAVAAEVQNIREQMKKDYPIKDDHVLVVESSGIPSKIRSILKDQLEDGTVVKFIDVAREARLVFKGIVPLHRRKLNEVIVLDIGSGNSKGAYLTKNTEPLEFETYNIDFGTGTFGKAVNAARQGGEPIAPVALRVAAEQILPSLRSQIRNKPGMQNCQRVYLAGGLPYVMATLMHPERVGAKDKLDPTGGKESEWVEMTGQEIQDFCVKAASDPGSLLQPDLSKLPADTREKATKELANVNTIFTQDELMAGAVLLKTFADEMRVDHNKKVFFSRAALYAWPQGYVTEVMNGQP